MDNEGRLRDFIYLDIERVRSYAAQLFGGIPETKTATEKIGGGTKIKGELGLKGIASIGGNTNLLYERGSQETLSLHHFLYNLFERDLLERGKIKSASIGEFPEGWGEGDFAETDFVLISGPVQIYDYENFIRKMASMPKLISALNVITQSSLKKKRLDQEISEEEFRKLSKSEKIEVLPKKEIESLTGVITELYSGKMRFKAFISEEIGGYYFVGLMEKEWLQSGITVGERFNIRSSTDWRVLAQVNYTKDLPTITAGNGESILDKLEAGIFLLGDLHKTFVSVSFPAISVTPIAIYRIC